MPIIDLTFKIQGTNLPVDHGYALFAAISQIIPELHHSESDTSFALHPVYGSGIGERKMRLNPKSRLTLRIPSEQIGRYLILCGKSLAIGREVIQVGVPEVRPLYPAAVLCSRLVTIKHHLEAGSFLAAILKEMEALKIHGTPSLVARTPQGSVEGKQPAAHQKSRDPFIRRTLRIRDKEIVGFALEVSELSAGDSLKLQEMGLGGRRHFGCGVFTAVK
jgi:CRISPR-associated protein Cas6